MLLALPVAFALLPLAGRSLFFHEDAMFIMYPGFSFYQSSIRAGDSFLWNPYNFSGFPTFAGVAAGFLSPIYFLAFKFIPYVDAYHLLIFLNVLLGAFLVSRFLRLLDAGVSAQYIGSIVYAFSNWSIIHDLSIVSVIPLAPLLFLSLWKIYRGKKYWVLIGGAGAGLILLAGHYQWLIEVLTFVGIASFFVAWAHGSQKLRDAFSMAGIFVGMMTIAGFIGLIRFIPAFLYVDYSARAVSQTVFEFVRSGLTFGDSIQFFSPYLHFGSLGNTLVPVSAAQKYIGIVPIVLLLSGFSLRSDDRMRSFFSYGALFIFLASISYSPVMFILHYLPIYRFLGGAYRWMFVFNFCASVLIGFGFEKILTRGIHEKVRKILSVFFIVGYAVSGGVVASWFIIKIFGAQILSALTRYFDTHWNLVSLQFPLEHYHQYIRRLFSEIASIVDLSDPKVFLPIIFFIVSLWAIKKIVSNSWQPDMAKAWVFGITVLNLAGVFFVGPILVSRSLVLDPSRTTSFVQNSGGGRIMPFLPATSEFLLLSVPYGAQVPPDVSFAFEKEIMQANLNLLYGVPSADYYDNLMSRRMSRVIAYLGASQAPLGENPAYSPATPEEKAATIELHKNMLDVIGVRYVTSAYPFDETRFSKVFTTEVTPFHIPISVYENKNARPLFYFADAVEVIPENEFAAFEKLKTFSESGRRIFIECPQGVDCSFFERTHFNGKGDISIAIKKNTFSVLKTDSAQDQFLVFSENNLPGWKTYVDGKEVPQYTVGSVYMGVAVPAGEHEIRFEFTYKSIFEEFLKMLTKKL